MTKKRTKKVTKKSPDIVLLAAPTNLLLIHIRWFSGIRCRDFLDFGGAEKMFIPSAAYGFVSRLGQTQRRR